MSYFLDIPTFGKEANVLNRKSGNHYPVTQSYDRKIWILSYKPAKMSKSPKIIIPNSVIFIVVSYKQGADSNRGPIMILFCDIAYYVTAGYWVQVKIISYLAAETMNNCTANLQLNTRGNSWNTKENKMRCPSYCTSIRHKIIHFARGPSYQLT